VTETLAVAELARTALLCQYTLAAGCGKATPHSEVFTGKHADNQPRMSHDHAYYLPTDEDGDGRIDHLTVWAEMGFPRAEVTALDALRWLPLGDQGDYLLAHDVTRRVREQSRRQNRDPGPGLRLLLVGLGQPKDFRCPVFETAGEWISATPYIVSRHFKERGRLRDERELGASERAPEFAAKVLREELDRRG